MEGEPPGEPEVRFQVTLWLGGSLALPGFIMASDVKIIQ